MHLHSLFEFADLMMYDPDVMERRKSERGAVNCICYCVRCFTRQHGVVVLSKSPEPCRKLAI